MLGSDGDTVCFKNAKRRFWQCNKKYEGVSTEHPVKINKKDRGAINVSLRHPPPLLKNN